MEVKTAKLTVKVLAADKLALERMAQAEGEAMAVIVRRLIRQAIRKPGALAGPRSLNAGEVRNDAREVVTA